MNKERLKYIESLYYKGIEDIKAPHIDDSAYIDFDRVTLGKDIVVGPLSVIGWLSIGMERLEDGRPLRMQQIGNVIIGNNVFICANVIIDRSTNHKTPTTIGDNVILASCVHVGHNVTIGDNTVIHGNAFIGGSAKIGRNCLIGANSSIRNKILIGDNVTIGMGAVVVKDVPNGCTIKSEPAKE